MGCALKGRNLLLGEQIVSRKSCQVSRREAKMRKVRVYSLECAPIYVNYGNTCFDVDHI